MINLAKVVTIDNTEFIVIERQEIPAIEFRVYYDKQGDILYYTTEKLEGDYIVVDKQVYIEARYDLCVIDKKLVKKVKGITIRKYKPDDTGIVCHSEDISILVDDNFKEIQKWKLHVNELR